MKRSVFLSLVVVTLAACDPDPAGGRQGVPWDGGALSHDDTDGAGDDGDDAEGDAAAPSDCVPTSSGDGGCGAPSADGVDPGAGRDRPDGQAGDPSPLPDPDGWDPAWAALEAEMLVLVNDLRARGADCGSSTMAPVPPLTMNPALRSAARHHSQDMADNGYFDHASLDGRSPWDRMAQAGYDAMPVGENIAAGSGTAAATFAQWVNSPGHCQNMLSPMANEIGVGVAVGGPYGAYWTQTFGVR